MSEGGDGSDANFCVFIALTGLDELLEDDYTRIEADERRRLLRFHHRRGRHRIMRASRR